MSGHSTQAVVCSSTRFVKGTVTSMACHRVVYHKMETLSYISSYITVSSCMHTVGTHAPAAYSDVTANTTTIPCTEDVHTPTVLSG